MTCLFADGVRALQRGQVTGPEAEALRAHLEECSECRALQGTLQGLGPDPRAAPDTLWDCAPTEAADGPPADRAPQPAPQPAPSEGDLQLLRGRTLGEYVIGELLGRGGMGAVFAALHTQTGRRAAIKVLHNVPQSTATTRFLAEATATSAIRHPNIIEVYDPGRTAEGWIYYAMELLRGRSLAQLMLDRFGEQRTFSPAEICPLLQQGCAGLQAAHDAGVVHRDLKPENIFIVEDASPEQVKLLDFGVAKLLYDDAGMTTSGMVLGTPTVISPEQATGDRRRVGPRSDLYSVGVILYWMLAGRPPFVDRQVYSLLRKHVVQPPPPLRQLAPDVPPAIEALVMQCLAKAPEARPASATEISRRFSPAVQALPAPAGDRGPRGGVPAAAAAPAPRDQQTARIVFSPRDSGPPLPPGDEDGPTERLLDRPRDRPPWPRLVLLGLAALGLLGALLWLLLT